MARFLPAAVAVLALAACSSSDPSGGGTDTFPPTSPAPSGTTAAGASDAPSTTAGGGATTGPAASAPATTTAPDLDAVKVKLTELGNFDQPIAIVQRDGVFYVAGQGGKVVALDADGSTHDVLDMSDRTKAAGEQGLLDLAFSPDGSHLYVSYTNNDGNSRIDEYAMDGETADASTRREVLAFDQPYANHNGGGILFGPDGLLYAGYGDGGSAGDPQRNGQKPTTLLSKILRIDPTPSGGAAYTIPPDNPYASGANGVRPEIWSTGLRNPWRFSFDAATGDLWVADVGQNAIEEIDRVPPPNGAAPAGSAGWSPYLGAGRGTNFGWSAYEGTARYNEDQQAPDSWMPIYEYDHGAEGCSVTGGFVYRGTAIPALQGAYLYSDYCAGGLRALVADGNQVAAKATLSDQPEQVVSFGTDADGELYVVSIGGTIYKVLPA